MNLQFIITRPYLFSTTKVSGQLCLPSSKIPYGIFKIDCWFSLLSVFILTSLPSFCISSMKGNRLGPLLLTEYILKLLLQAARRTWNYEISPREFAMVCLTVRICRTSCLVATVAPATSTVPTALCASLHISAATETLTVQTAAMRRLAVSYYLLFNGVIQLNRFVPNPSVLLTDNF